MSATTNNTRTRKITNLTSDPMVIEFPLDDPSVNNGLQVYCVSGTVEFKGVGRLLGAESEYIEIPIGTSMTFENQNANPNGPKTIRLQPGAIANFIAYD